MDVNTFIEKSQFKTIGEEAGLSFYPRLFEDLAQKPEPYGYSLFIFKDNYAAFGEKEKPNTYDLPSEEVIEKTVGYPMASKRIDDLFFIYHRRSIDTLTGYDVFGLCAYQSVDSLAVLANKSPIYLSNALATLYPERISSMEWARLLHIALDDTRPHIVSRLLLESFFKVRELERGDRSGDNTESPVLTLP